MKYYHYIYILMATCNFFWHIVNCLLYLTFTLQRNCKSFAYLSSHQGSRGGKPILRTPNLKNMHMGFKTPNILKLTINKDILLNWLIHMVKITSGGYVTSLESFTKHFHVIKEEKWQENVIVVFETQEEAIIIITHSLLLNKCCIFIASCIDLKFWRKQLVFKRWCNKNEGKNLVMTKINHSSS